MFPRKRGWADCSLVISHKMRQRINSKQNQDTKTEDAVLLKGSDGEMWLHPHLKLIAHMQERKHGFVNNGSYRVVEIGEQVKLTCEASQRELVVPLDFVRNYLRLCFAITIASCQGSTIKGRLRVYSAHPRFTMRHLFVCSSRATAAALLEIV